MLETCAFVRGTATFLALTSSESSEVGDKGFVLIGTVAASGVFAAETLARSMQAGCATGDAKRL